jgi:hypothetical protein
MLKLSRLIMMNLRYVYSYRFSPNSSFSFFFAATKFVPLTTSQPHYLPTSQLPPQKTIIQDETVEKLPTFKAFFKGESIGHHVGIKLEQIQALLTQLNQRVSSTTENGTQSTAVVQDAKTTAPAAHPALSILANDTILKGSRALPHLTPTPQELIDFKASLSNYAIVVFYSAKDDVTTSSTPQMKSTLSNNTVIQLFNDLKLLQDRFSNDAHKIEIRRIKIDQNEPNTMILAKEYGCDDNDLPVVKMMYKSTVWATVRNGNAFEVEAKLPEFVQL